MIYTRRYVQYNDLPFDNYEMLRSWDDSTTKFKQESSQYSYKNGSYTVFKSPTMLVEKTNVSMSVLLEMKRLACDRRTSYRKFVIDEISKPGKLWAVQNGELVWAYAYPDNYSEASQVSIAESLVIDIDFVLYEGIWHKASAFTTFLEEYDLCDEMEDRPTYDQCADYKERNKDCCFDCFTGELTRTTCNCTTDYGCECNKERKSICDIDIANTFYGYGCDSSGYRIVEDCSKFETENKDPIGTKFRAAPCSNYLSGKIYANTDVATTDYEIVIVGTFHNPYVEVNGNGNVIEGDYTGSLKIRGDGTIWILNGDCGWQELPVSALVIPEGMELGFTFNPGWNFFKIDAGECNCNYTLTAYINIDNITY